MECITEGVYLIWVREFKDSNKPIYKVGRSNNLQNRIKSYPNDSFIITLMECCESVKCEKEILKTFNETFEKKTRYGNEYFEGDKTDMMLIMANIVSKINKEAEKEKKKLEKEKKLIEKKTKKEEVKESVVVEEKKEEKKIENKNNDDRTCPNCKTVFKYPSTLKTHLKQTYHCKIANDFFIKEQEMNPKEEVNYEDINNLQCGKCKKIFNNNRAKKRHLIETKCGKSINKENNKVMLSKLIKDNPDLAKELLQEV